MIPVGTHKETIVVHGRFDIPRARSGIRQYLTIGHYPARFIGRSITIFSALCELLFELNGGGSIEVHVQLLHGVGIQFKGRLPGAATIIYQIQQQSKTLQAIADEFSVQPDQGYIYLTVGLDVKKE